MAKDKTILIIGPAPDNIGGVSIHIRRLISLLADDYNFDIVDEGHKRWPGIFNLRSLNLFKYFQKLAHADIVHIHSGTVMLRICNVLAAKLMGKKTIVTIHRDPTIESKQGLTKSIMTLCDTVICVSEKGMKAVRKGKGDKYRHIPAFLPPDINKEPPLPQEVNDFIEKAKQRGDKIMVSNAGKLVFKDGVDLYGLDMCVDATIMLNQQGESCSMIFALPDMAGHEDYVQSLREKLKSSNMEHKVLIVNYAISFVKLMLATDIVLRPTITDGDAITVREGLYLCKPVVASDVVERPEHTILHATRDLPSMVNAIKSASANASSSISSDGYRETYSQLYNTLIHK